MSLTDEITVELISLDRGRIDHTNNFKQYFDELSEYTYAVPPYAEGSEIEVNSEPRVYIGYSTVTSDDSHYSIIDINADFKYFHNSDNVRERLHSYLKIVKLIYNLVNPVYGFGVNNVPPHQYGNEIMPTVTADGLKDPQIEQPAWIMLFSPEMVDHYGRDWLESLPVDYTETLEDGGVLIVTNEDAGDMDACAESMDALTEEFVNRF